MYTTDQYQGMTAETISIQTDVNEYVHAYMARPMGAGPFPGVVLAHHIPGWDSFYKEVTRKFAEQGYVAICPDLYCRTGHGIPEDIAAQVRGAGGVADDQAVSDLASAAGFLRAMPYLNGRVGIIGTCSGGRHAYLAACRTQTLFDAAIDCWGGNVVQNSDKLTALQPVAPIDYTKDLSCPLLGLFGEEDQNPPPQQVAQHETELKKYNKEYEFHMYPGAGHGFFYYDRAMYRQEQANDAWAKVWAFFNKFLTI